MKLNWKIILSLLLVVFVTVSCEKLDLLNENPNEPEYINPDYLFTYSVLSGIGGYNNDVGLNQRGIMRWMMYFAVRGGVESDKVYESPSGRSGFWQENYADALNNTQEIINLTKDDDLLINKNSIARIWKVYLFHRVTDMWGSIPYTEALQGYTELNKMPKYDTQKDIYLSFFSELEDAISKFDHSKESFDNADILFNGDIDSWIRFANSLRLKLAIRIKNVEPGLYSSELAKLQSVDFINSNSNAAIFMHNTEKKTAIYEAYLRNESTEQNNPSKFLVDMLVSNNDPRVIMYFEKSPDSNLPWVPDYQGIPNLVAPNSDIWENYSNNWSDISSIGNWFLRADVPNPILSYSEVCFLKAEASLDGYFGNTLDLLKEGVRANMDYLNFYAPADEDLMEIGDIDMYINNIAEANLENIINEKWKSFAFQNAYEAWTDYRRTSYPTLKDYDNNPIPLNELPVRLQYPTSEINLNGENYSQAIAEQGPDDQTTKIWWDVN